MSKLGVAKPGRIIVVSVLWLAVMASALAVVQTSHACRQLFSQLEELRRDENHLQVMWSQYLLEQSTWAAYGRVERNARESLDMEQPDMARVERVAQ